MNGWSSKDVTRFPSGAQVVGASESNVLISTEGWPITAGGATRGMVVKVVCSAVTAGAGITVKLQTAIGVTYEDSKTAAVTTNGAVYIKILAETAGDQTYLPLLNKGQVVITTGAGSAATITSVEILQEL